MVKGVSRKDSLINIKFLNFFFIRIYMEALGDSQPNDRLLYFNYLEFSINNHLPSIVSKKKDSIINFYY